MPQLDIQALCDETPGLRELGVRMERTPNGVTINAVLDAKWSIDDMHSIAHGGIVATLLDTAATFALIAQSDHDWATIDLRIDYLRPTRLGPLVVEGEVIHAGKRIGRARGSLTDSTGRLCAVATGTFAPSMRD
jgi:uncharacterized protein (TIGR00369 family)